jgi:hypothetical protein
MKHYKENKENKDMVFDNRRTDAIKSVKDEQSVENITDTLNNTEDPWLSAKG